MSLLPTYLWLVFLLGLAKWYGCGCCPTVSGCSCCESTPSTVSVTISGLVDDHCDKCDDLNGTYVLDKDAPLDPVTACRWSTTGTIECTWNSWDIRYTVYVLLTCADVYTIISINLDVVWAEGDESGMGHHWDWNKSVAAVPMDCTAPRTGFTTMSIGLSGVTPPCSSAWPTVSFN